jgi:catechol 2,3-dioxygenase-like lactoylglutathione lyase family enzyme
MKQHIAHIALVVRDYDEAIQFYTQKLHFRLVEDTVLISGQNAGFWWHRRDQTNVVYYWQKPLTRNRKKRSVIKQGGRVFLFLYTDNFRRDYEAMIKEGVEFVREPKVEAYGTVAVFKDLYGNLWDLLEPANNFIIDLKWKK